LSTEFLAIGIQHDQSRETIDLELVVEGVILFFDVVR
jgi:hypothetical protein